ncbi:MAG: copper resistance protein CopC [Alphaproteobacteria bacterium]
MRAVLLALFGVAAWATAASAHASLVSSDPADGASVPPPAALSLAFSESLSLTHLVLTDAAALEIDTGFAVDSHPAPAFSVPLPALAPGTYRVEWRGLSDDGHPAEGAFAFTVQSP